MKTVQTCAPFAVLHLPLAVRSHPAPKMPYSNFSLQAAVKQFDLKYQGSDLVFPTSLPSLPAPAEKAIPFLMRQIERDADLARRTPTDQAKLAFVIAPVLATLRPIHKVGIHSGVTFDVSPMENLQVTPYQSQPLQVALSRYF